MDTLASIFSVENMLIASMTMLATSFCIMAVWLAMASILGDP